MEGVGFSWWSEPLRPVNDERIRGVPQTSSSQRGAAATWEVFAGRVDGMVKGALASKVQEGRVSVYSKCEAGVSLFLQEHDLEGECMVKHGDLPSEEVNYLVLSKLEERLQLMVFIAFG